MSTTTSSSSSSHSSWLSLFFPSRRHVLWSGGMVCLLLLSILLLRKDMALQQSNGMNNNNKNMNNINNNLYQLDKRKVKTSSSSSSSSSLSLQDENTPAITTVITTNLTFSVVASTTTKNNDMNNSGDDNNFNTTMTSNTTFQQEEEDDDDDDDDNNNNEPSPPSLEAKRIPPSRYETPNDALSYEPKRIHYFWNRMADRPFMKNHLYPALGQSSHFHRILDVGARGYNQYCQSLLNSTTTRYYQVEPHPPLTTTTTTTTTTTNTTTTMMNKMNNDGLLHCKVQELSETYPQFQHFFDVVLDLGVFGWSEVHKNFTTLLDMYQDIQEYITNLLFVLKEQVPSSSSSSSSSSSHHQKKNRHHHHNNNNNNSSNSSGGSMWILKLDDGWIQNETYVWEHYINPYFNQGTFAGYPSGYRVKHFRFFFLYRKPSRKPGLLDDATMITMEKNKMDPKENSHNTTTTTTMNATTTNHHHDHNNNDDASLPPPPTSSSSSLLRSSKNETMSNAIVPSSSSSSSSSLSSSLPSSSSMSSSTIRMENQYMGTADWIITHPALNREMEGYLSHTSINAGETILLFYHTKTRGTPTSSSTTSTSTTLANNYGTNITSNYNNTTITKNNNNSKTVVIDVFRTGWYGGKGARRYDGPIVVPAISQSIPRPDHLGTVVCQWKDPYPIMTNTTWTSGIYLVRMTESETNLQSYAIFVVRNDDRHSSADILFQIPVHTYQAYNFWGGKSLYGWGSGGPDRHPWGTVPGRKAHKVSFDRPYARSNHLPAAYGNGAGEYLTNIQPRPPGYMLSSSAGWNYNMVRWLERHGLDVTYITNLDCHSRLPHLLKPKVFLTQGHDEYWTNEMRDNVENWRDQGVHLLFLGSNTAYFQVRLEEGPINPYVNTSLYPGLAPPEPRLIVCYKFRGKDPVRNHLKTVVFRNVRPEAWMVGIEYIADPYDDDLVVANPSHWVFAGTGVSKGDRLPGLLGYEVDGLSPATALRNITVVPLFETIVVDRYNSNKTWTCMGTMYTAEKSGAHVFAAGTMQWSWALDDFNVEQKLRPSRLSRVVEQVMWNLFQAFGIVDYDI